MRQKMKSAFKYIDLNQCLNSSNAFSLDEFNGITDSIEKKIIK